MRRDLLVSSMMCKSFLLAATTATLLLIAFFSDGASAASCNINTTDLEDPENVVWLFEFGPFPFPDGFSTDDVVQVFNQTLRSLWDIRSPSV
jgi:hypothetical protein